MDSETEAWLFILDSLWVLLFQDLGDLYYSMTSHLLAVVIQVGKQIPRYGWR